MNLEVAEQNMVNDEMAVAYLVENLKKERLKRKALVVNYWKKRASMLTCTLCPMPK